MSVPCRAVIFKIQSSVGFPKKRRISPPFCCLLQNSYKGESNDDNPLVYSFNMSYHDNDITLCRSPNRTMICRVNLFSFIILLFISLLLIVTASCAFLILFLLNDLYIVITIFIYRRISIYSIFFIKK